MSWGQSGGSSGSYGGGGGWGQSGGGGAVATGGGYGGGGYGGGYGGGGYDGWGGGGYSSGADAAIASYISGMIDSGQIGGWAGGQVSNADLGYGGGYPGAAMGYPGAGGGYPTPAGIEESWSIPGILNQAQVTNPFSWFANPLQNIATELNPFQSQEDKVFYNVHGQPYSKYDSNLVQGMAPMLGTKTAGLAASKLTNQAIKGFAEMGKTVPPAAANVPQWMGSFGNVFGKLGSYLSEASKSTPNIMKVAIPSILGSAAATTYALNNRAQDVPASVMEQYNNAQPSWNVDIPSADISLANPPAKFNAPKPGDIAAQMMNPTDLQIADRNGLRYFWNGTRWEQESRDTKDTNTTRADLLAGIKAANRPITQIFPDSGQMRDSSAPLSQAAINMAQLYAQDPYKYWAQMNMLTPEAVARLTGGKVKPGEPFKGVPLSYPSYQWWANLMPSEQSQILGALNWMGIDPEDWKALMKRMIPGLASRQLETSWTR